jgi:uncharacterized protein (DUF2147 family)
MRPKARPLRGTSVLSRSAAAIAGLLLLATTRALASTPEGLWYAEGGAAKVLVERCGEALCGRVAWLRSPFDESGCALHDEHNPDARLRPRSLEGLEILQGLERSPLEENVWIGGTIYDPTSGRTYRCRLTLDGDRIHLHGYVGVPLLGRTTTWLRVGAESRMCREHDAESRP